MHAQSQLPAGWEPRLSRDRQRPRSARRRNTAGLGAALKHPLKKRDVSVRDIWVKLKRSSLRRKYGDVYGESEPVESGGTG